MKNAINIGIFILIFTLSSHYVYGAAYKLSMLPRYSSEEINKRITVLSKYLGDQTGIAIEPVISANFAQYQKQLANGIITIGYENPYIYVLTSQAHEVIAMAVKGKDGDKFRGIVITRADSQLRSLDELAGKTISIVGRNSAGGFLSQRLSLLRQGIDVQKDCTIIDAVDNKQENVILAVFTGDVDAGFIRESALNHIDKYIPAAQIKILTATAWLPNWAVSVKRSLPEEEKVKIQNALLTIGAGHPVLETLRIKSFRKAGDGDYDPVRQAAGLLNNVEN